MICSDCHVTFKSQQCFLNHKEVCDGGMSICQMFWQCPICRRYMEYRKRSPADHKCSEYLCGSCHKYVEDDSHQCYLRRQGQKTPSDKIIFFDYECTQNSGEHKPNFVVAQSCCEKSVLVKR